jgi:hypothetical protein
LGTGCSFTSSECIATAIASSPPRAIAAIP